MSFLYYFFKSNASKLSIGLVVLIFANFLFQFYSHKTSALSPWKGGGFGMYTEPHVVNRSVWVAFQTDGEDVHVRLYPKAKSANKSVSRESRMAYRALVQAARDFRFYPTDGGAKRIGERASGLDWAIKELSGDANPSASKVFVFENAIDMQAASVTRRVIFESGVGDE